MKDAYLALRNTWVLFAPAIAFVIGWLIGHREGRKQGSWASVVKEAKRAMKRPASTK